MDNSCSVIRVLRKTAFFALVGFAVIFLTGPVLAVLSFIVSAGLFVFFFLLPFMLVGLLVWLPFRAIRGNGACAGRDLLRTGQFMGRAAFVVPMRACGRVCAKAGTVRDRIHHLTCFIGTVFMETISGALVGTLLGAIAGYQTPLWRYSIPAGAIIGAGLGVIVGASRARQPAESFSGPVAD